MSHTGGRSMRRMLKQRAIEQFEIAGAVRAWRWMIFLPAMVGFWTWLAVETFLIAQNAWPGIEEAVGAGTSGLEDWTYLAHLTVTTLTSVALPALVTWGAMRAARGSWPIRAAGWLLLLEQLLAVASVFMFAGWTGVTDIAGADWLWLGAMSLSATVLIMTRGPQVGGQLSVHAFAVFAALLWRAMSAYGEIAPDTQMTTAQLVSSIANDAVSVRWRLHFAALCIALPVMMISRAATIVAQNTSKQLFYQGFNIIPDWQHAPDPVAPTSTQRESQPPEQPAEPPTPPAEPPQP